jgi:hypothetical protein
MTFVVGPGVKGRIVLDGKYAGQKAEERDYTTRRTSEFSDKDVLFHPSGQVGKYGPNSQTLAGHYAAEGFVGFSGPGMVLIVPASDVREAG